MRALTAFVLSVALVAAGALSGQTLTRLDSAARVRVTAPARGVHAQVGTVLAHRSDTLWLLTVPAGDTLTLPVRELTRVGLSRGLHGHAGRGAAIGVVSGALLGAALGYAFASDPDDCGFTPCGPGIEAAGGAFLGSLVGVVTGAIVGANQRTERWQIVLASPSPLTTSTHWPGMRHFGIALHRTF